MKIYIARHGETQWNRAGRMQGWKNSDLTEKGIENAKKLGESLKDIEFDSIYCSPLGRAVDTAKYIKGPRDIKININEALKEMGFGIWEGMDNLKIEELYSTHRFNFWNKPHLYEPIDGESYEELLERVEKALNDIINDDSGDNILIVAHAAVIKAIYAIVKNYSLEDFWSPPFIHGTCLTILEVKDKEIQMVLEADTSHLD